MIFNQSYSLNNQSTCTKILHEDLFLLLSLFLSLLLSPPLSPSLPPPFPPPLSLPLSPPLSSPLSPPLSLLLSLSSSLSPSADYHKSYLRATYNHCVSNSSNKPIHMYPQLPEGEINSGVHTYVARQTGRDRQVDRQTGRQMDHLHFHEVSVLQSNSSVRSQRGEVADAVVERHTCGKCNTCKHSSNHTGGIN